MQFIKSLTGRDIGLETVLVSAAIVALAYFVAEMIITASH